MRTLLAIALLISLAAGCGPAMDANNLRRDANANANANSANSVNAEGSPAPSVQDTELSREFEEIAAQSGGKVGVYAVEIESGRTASLNAGDRFAMQSVVKLPISMAVVAKAAKGELDLDAKVTVRKDELVPEQMRSPFRDKYPEGGTTTARELIALALIESDGTAADVLQRLAGGAEAVQAYVDSLGVNGMQIRYSHQEFFRDWQLQYENWATPEAAVGLLRSLWSQRGQAGSGAEQKELLIIQNMADSKPGANRLKALLPAGTFVAHKTGTGGTRDGITSATNDVGIIRLPSGKHVAIAVFVGDSKASESVREATIAKIAKAVWDKWTSSAGKGFIGSIDFDIEGVSIGTPYAEVVEKLGSGISTRVNPEECVQAEIFYLKYPGLEIGMLGDGKDLKKYKVTSMELESAGYQFGGLRIGASKQDIMLVYGQPISDEDERARLVYVTKENDVWIGFHYADGVVNRVSVTETLC